MTGSRALRLSLPLPLLYSDGYTATAERDTGPPPPDPSNLKAAFLGNGTQVPVRRAAQLAHERVHYSLLVLLTTVGHGSDDGALSLQER